MSGRCVCRDSKELLVGSSFYAACYGPGRPSGGVHVPVGIRLKRSEEEKCWNRNQNTSPNYPERAETFEGSLAGSGEPVRCCHVVGGSLCVLLRLSTFRGGSSAIGKQL